MKAVNFENVLISDPLKIRKYDTPHFKSVYTICVLIPSLLAFSLVFFLIFFMSPHGRNMRQYQREIFEWNKENIASQMDQLSFAFKIAPYINVNSSQTEKIIMQHHDTPTKTEAEKELHSLLNYKQSYFLFNDTEYVFPKLNLKNKTNIPIGPSEDYCIHIWWKQQSRDKTYDESFQNVTELPLCQNSKQQTKYKWGLNEFDHGVSFQAWRETQQKLWCANFSCEYDCSFHGGIYRNGTCYKYEVLRRLCIKIDFDRDSKEDQIEFQGGCYESDEVGLYEQAKPNETYSLEYIPLEVRHKQDPYIVYAESHYNLGRDLSIFFWLSVGCLAASLLLTVLLSFCFCFIIKNSDRNKRKYVREDLN